MGRSGASEVRVHRLIGLSFRIGALLVGALLVGALCAVAGASGDSAAGAPYRVQKQYQLGGAGGWDYLTLDPSAQRLYISRSDRVLVMDTRDGTIVATIPDTQGVHGIALAPELGKGFASNGRADTVTVFDLKSLKSSGTIPVGGHNPDAIVYDKASRHVYTFNGRSKDISVIDPQRGAVIATIAAGGKPEFAVADGAGRIFYNIEDTAQLSAIDSSAAKRIATWPLVDCESPTGLAYDVAHRRLFSACDNGVMVVTDALSGAHVASLPIGKGPDAAAFDADRSLIFIPNGGDGTLTVIREIDPDHYSVIATVITQKSARTMALDAQNHRAYLVAAEFGPVPAPTSEQPRPRAPVIDGTFKVLVVGN
jgi:YVTN family beta-propeller protein